MSLTNTAKKFRISVKILSVVMVIYYVLILIIIPNTRDLILNLLVDRNPPNPKYGLLDPLKFEPALRKGGKSQIVLNTANGRLPAGLPKKMTVYKFKGIQYSYLSGKGAQADADLLGFSEAELISDLKGKEYQWRSLTSGGVLQINTETRSILADIDLFGKQDEYKAGTIDAETAKKYAIDIFTGLGRFDSRIYKSENFKAALGQFAGRRVIETKATADAQLARVDFYGQLDKYPIFGPNATKGLVWLVLRKPTKEMSPYNYPVIESYFWDLVNEKDASYQIITVQEAWKQVVEGKGVISSIVPKNANPFASIEPAAMEKMLINSIYLAYYETPQFQKHLQPIYVFQGRYSNTGTEGGDVVIYYPAITAAYTKAESSVVPQAPQTSESTSPFQR